MQVTPPHCKQQVWRQFWLESWNYDSGFPLALHDAGKLPPTLLYWLKKCQLCKGQPSWQMSCLVWSCKETFKAFPAPRDELGSSYLPHHWNSSISKLLIGSQINQQTTVIIRAKCDKEQSLSFVSIISNHIKRRLPCGRLCLFKLLLSPWKIRSHFRITRTEYSPSVKAHNVVWGSDNKLIRRNSL